MKYLSNEEYDRLQVELDDRIGRRLELSERIGKARDLGDLKENAEYHAAREDQGLNEAKIRELEQDLKEAILVDSSEVPEGVVYIGTTVKLKNSKTGDEDLYRLVGEATGRFDIDYVEVTPNSALGEALMKRQVGETVSVDLPKGRTDFDIVEIMD
ncbi:MAG: transcription elongation factor GreA [Phycisphaerales bacterium]|nr:transcription elongation factor GreA [Phycisphaerales bacterium]